ncbi:MAG: alcohol dehydrogenase catalytic domain-containing protein [Planctomycetota bacterium]|jgi:L-iditol 2-dehydrogenase
MKAMQLTGIRKMEMVDVPDPEISSDNDVLIKMLSIGVCGSDIHYYVSGKIGRQTVEYPFTVGHEGAGRVVETGSAVTHVKPGDRIAIEPAMPCRECDQCKAGRHHTCRNLRFLGCPKQAEGCLSEYIVMPETSCIKISDHVSMVEAALSEPLAIGVYGVKQSIPMTGAKIGVLGAGPIGFSVFMPALSMGAPKAYVTDKIDARLELAQKAGASWTGNPDTSDIVSGILSAEPLGLDAVFDCCGDQEALDQAIEILKPGGKLMIIGIPEFDRFSFPVDRLRHKEICIQNVRRQCECVQSALEMIEKKNFDVNVMATHHFGFEETKEAFDLVADYKDGVLKAMIEFSG